MPRLAKVLANFSAYMSSLPCNNPVKVWGNGANFDNVILTESYRACLVARPWGTFDDACFRTLKNLGRDLGIAAPAFKGVKHNALDDAKHQARHAITILNFMGVSK